MECPVSAESDDTAQVPSFASLGEDEMSHVNISDAGIASYDNACNGGNTYNSVTVHSEQQAADMRRVVSDPSTHAVPNTVHVPRSVSAPPYDERDTLAASRARLPLVGVQSMASMYVYSPHQHPNQHPNQHPHQHPHQHSHQYPHQYQRQMAEQPNLMHPEFSDYNSVPIQAGPFIPSGYQQNNTHAAPDANTYAPMPSVHARDPNRAISGTGAASSSKPHFNTNRRSTVPTCAPRGSGAAPDDNEPRGEPERKKRKKSVVSAPVEGRQRTRAERNRESAEKSRQRQKQRTERLELDVYAKRLENREVKASIDTYYAQLRSVAEAIERDPDHAAKAAKVPSLFNSLAMMQSAIESCVWTYKDPSEIEIPLKIPRS